MDSNFITIDKNYKFHIDRRNEIVEFAKNLRRRNLRYNVGLNEIRDTVVFSSKKRG